MGHVSGADPLGAFEVDGQPGRLHGELAFAGGAGLDIVHPLLDSLVDAFGILGRQGGHQREGTHAMLERIFTRFRLALVLLGPVLFCALRWLAAICAWVAMVWFLIANGKRGEWEPRKTRNTRKGIDAGRGGELVEVNVRGQYGVFPSSWGLGHSSSIASGTTPGQRARANALLLNE